MTVREFGSIINGRFIQNPHLGLWYNLNILHPQDFSDTQKLNEEVDRIRPLIYKGGFNYLPTIGLLEKQWNNFSPDFKNVLDSKVHWLLYKGGWNPDMPYPKLGNREVDIVCVPAGLLGEDTWKCYTKWDDNAFAFRFVKTNEPIVEPPIEEPDEPGEEEPPVLSGGVIHMVCPHCKKLIF